MCLLLIREVISSVETKVETFMFVCSHLTLSQFLFFVLILQTMQYTNITCCRCHGLDLEYKVCYVLFSMLVLQHVA